MAGLDGVREALVCCKVWSRILSFGLSNVLQSLANFSIKKLFCIFLTQVKNVFSYFNFGL